MHISKDIINIIYNYIVIDKYNIDNTICKYIYDIDDYIDLYFKSIYREYERDDYVVVLKSTMTPYSYYKLY